MLPTYDVPGLPPVLIHVEIDLNLVFFSITRAHPDRDVWLGQKQNALSSTFAPQLELPHWQPPSVIFIQCTTLFKYKPLPLLVWKCWCGFYCEPRTTFVSGNESEGEIRAGEERICVRLKSVPKLGKKIVSIFLPACPVWVCCQKVIFPISDLQQTCIACKCVWNIAECRMAKRKRVRIVWPLQGVFVGLGALPLKD